MWWVIHMCRGFDPLFSLWQDRARSFWGIFSHPPTPKRSFGVLKLPILTEFDLLGPKFHFSLDLFGSNFQRPAAHPHHFSDRVPPPGLLFPTPGTDNVILSDHVQFLCVYCASRGCPGCFLEPLWVINGALDDSRGGPWQACYKSDWTCTCKWVSTFASLPMCM